MRSMESLATAAAMAFDGVRRGTVKMFVLDQDLKVQPFDGSPAGTPPEFCDLRRMLAD
jgi:hypothetical protein